MLIADTGEKVSCSSKLNGYAGVSYTLSPSTVAKKAQLKHVMVFLGNAQLVIPDLLAKWADYAHTNQVRVTVVEHPGAMRSDIKRTPRVFNDLINNGAEVFSAIQKKYGLQSSEIGLYGMSLGGAIATQVASRFYKTKENCPHLLVDRSFSSITSVIVGWILPNKPRTLAQLALFALVQIPLAMIAYAIVKPLLLLTGWEAHTGVYYAHLPKARKHYLFVRTNKADRKAGDHRGDGIITRLASLDSSVFQVVPRLMRKYWTKWFGTKKEYAILKSERASHKIIMKKSDIEHMASSDLQRQLNVQPSFHNVLLHNMPLTYCHDHGTFSRQSRSGDAILTDWIQHNRPIPRG